MSLLATIDIGTTLIKAGVFDEAGTLAGMASEPFDLICPGEGLFELNPDACWRAICRAVHAAVQRAGADGKDVAAVGLSSQGQTVVPIDANGKALDHFIVWLDRRASTEADEIASHFGPDHIYGKTGVSALVPGHTVSVLWWWQRNRPEVFSRASRFLLTKDYAIFRMTGRCTIDHQLAGSTACYSVLDADWWSDVLEFIGVDAELLPGLCRPEEVAGTLSSSAASDLGLSAGCPVVTGTWDQIAGALGAGNVRPGMVTEMTGSCLALFATCKEFLPDPKRRMLAGRHAIGSYGYLLPYTEYGGKALQLVRKSCYGESTPYDEITADAARIPVGSDGLVMALDQTGTAVDARDAFVNMSPEHDRAHMVRAAMEAVAFALKAHVDALGELGVPVGSIIALGGGAQSDLWLQMKADLLGLPVTRPACTEAALLGAAILAGRAQGMFGDVADTAAQMAQMEHTVEPHADVLGEWHTAYQHWCHAIAENAPPR